MSMKAAFPCVAALAAALLATAPAGAQGKDEEEEGGEEDASEDTVVVDDAKPEPKPKQEEFKKQDLRGHAVDSSSATNLFEKDRFFVDKVDSK